MILLTKKSLINVSVFIYFVFLILTQEVENYAVFVGFYASLLLCSIVGLYSQKFIVPLHKILVILSMVMLTGINLIFVGNATVNDVVYVGLFALTSFALTSAQLEENTMLIVLGLNIVVVLYKLLTVGVTGQIYISASRNFVSVFLMYPLVLYYSIIARKNKDINIIPIVISWIICLVARGRGGIISCTVFLVAICLIKYKGMKSTRKLITTLIFIIGLSIVMLNLPAILAKISGSAVFELFAANGMRSSRTSFWPEYLELATSNLRNFVLGANTSKTFIGLYLDGNPHNSFIEIHMLTGIIGVAMVLILLVKSGIRSFKSGNLLFLACMISMLIRAFTDHVLWASFGTPMLFFLLFYNDASDIRAVQLRRITDGIS